MSNLTLQDYLTEWSKGDASQIAVAATLDKLSKAGIEIAKVVAMGQLAGDMAAVTGGLGGGDPQKALDRLANELTASALRASPVAWMGSEEDEQPVPLNKGAALAVNVDPLDGSSNIDTNVSIGTIFSILPADGENALLKPGREQLAAGYIIYGPQTSIVLTVGEGTHIFTLNPKSDEFLMAKANVKIPETTREYGVNASNFRFWDAAMKAYMIDCQLGADGPRKMDFNMRWVGSLVADAFRIFMRGGIYLYPGDSRKGYGNGRLRLLYEGNPIAMLIEQAGGACTTGTTRIMDVIPKSLHQRTPLIFGSKGEVEEVARYYANPERAGDSSLLFAERNPA